MNKVESFELDHRKVKAPYVRKCCLLEGPKGDKVTKFKAGDRVTCPPLIPCFKCKYCEMVNILFMKTTIIMVQEEMVHLHNISQ